MENDTSPQYDADEAANKEKIYKNLIAIEKNLDVSNSQIFRTNKNKVDYFDLLGTNDDEKISKYDSMASEKLKNISNFIRIDLPGIYAIDDLTV